MAITSNGTAAGDDTEGANATTNPGTITIAAGSNRCAYLFSSGNADTATEHTMTFDAVGMTEIIDNQASPSFHTVAAAYLHESGGWSGSGSKNWVDNWTTSRKIASLCLLLDGVDSAAAMTGLQSRSTAGGSGDTSTQLTVTSAAGRKVISVFVHTVGQVTPTFETGETSLGQHWDDDGVFGAVASWKDGEASTVVGITNMGGGAARRGRQIAFSVSPAAVSGVMRKLSSIGTGGMSSMTGGMQGRAHVARNRIVVPNNFCARDISRLRARQELRA